MDQALVIFIKNPIEGKVKKRIAADAGDAAALEIYKNLLDHTRIVADQAEATRLLFYSERVVRLDKWSEKKYSKSVQSGNDLGERMLNAFKQTTEYDKKIIIGSDCPGLTSDIIEEAYDALDFHDVVIGPAQDGGYYLLGMTNLVPELFQSIPWSTDQVLNETVRVLQNKRLLYKLLPTLRDVDTWEDWQAEKGKLLREQTI
ncbi:MAG: TIGR04282 family arsenosugar biosynthesis glycosyltransferase [Saprospiraceae bacterium]